MNTVTGEHEPLTPDGALHAGALLDVRVRVSVEIGRVRMPLERAVALANGSIVDLDRRFDEPVEVYVNGRHFGSGRLLACEDEWALKLEQIDTEHADPDALAAPEEQPEAALEEAVESGLAASAEAEYGTAEQPLEEPGDDSVEQPSNADSADLPDAD